MRKTLVVVSILASACKGGGGPTGTGGTSAPAKSIAIAYGDCATPATPFESGPRPAKFSPDDLVAPTKAALEDEPDPATYPDDPPPPAMALDEGKMGKPDKDPADPAEARRQAIAAARSAGILGAGASAEDDGALIDPPSANGGFGYGRAGFGPGGSGTGWGTIGTGRYGTIGHSSGSGYGGGRGVPAVPTVSIGAPSTNGDLDKAIIRRYIKRNINKIQYCYERQLLVTPSIAGTVNVQFSISPSGVVTTATATGFDKTVSTCVAGAIKAIEFPKPKGGGGVQVTYPFTFRPIDWSGTGHNDAPPTPPNVAATPTAPPAPTAPPQVATTPVAPPAPSTAPTPPYKPGKDNPLAAQDAALRACVAKAPVAYGAVIVDLAYAGGKVTSATATGTDADTAACIAAAAKLATAGTMPAQRCGFAYGEMPASALPAVDVTADAIQLNGKEVTKIAALPAQASASFKIDALATALPAPDTSPPPLAIRTPFALRPVDAAPIGVVMRAAETLGDTGADFYFTAMRGAAWTPLRDPQATFPQPPVPAGTGHTWGAKRNALRDLGMPADEHVVMSLLVTKTTIWVGVSRINEFMEITRDGADAGIGKLAAKLADAKQSAFFADRDDLEIGGESAVTWGEIVAVIDAATKAGFHHWRLGEPEALAARPQL